MAFQISELEKTQRRLYDASMTIMDANYSPPLLWDTAKLSTWYAAGLLGRDGPGDRDRAAKLVQNALAQTYTDPAFIQNLHSFKDTMEMPLASGEKPLWVSHIYDSYDPNNALFVTMAGILIDSLFADRLPPAIMQNLREAMHKATRGNIPRCQDWFGDDMCASYSNPFFMRCACAAYVGKMMGDQELVDLSNSWTKEAADLWRQHDTPGEFNSPTYIGVTLMALGLGQFCPEDSAIAKLAPELLQSTWRSLGETYNPSLKNVAGPWDRTYGYCMTRYFACVGVPIACVLDDADQAPLPFNLDGCPHYSDIAMVPMQMMVARYVQQALEPNVKTRLQKLQPHNYQAKSDFAPYDIEPRQYSYCLSEGLSVGGTVYNETRIGGPKGEITQFVPGTIQWDSGKHGGGVGWITIWPTTERASIVASTKSLSISFPTGHSGKPASSLVLHISCLPFFQLDGNSWTTSKQDLPGLTVSLEGNIADKAVRKLRFDNKTTLHEAKYYELTFEFEGKLAEGEVPKLVLDLTKTEPPTYPFVW